MHAVTLALLALVCAPASANNGKGGGVPDLQDQLDDAELRLELAEAELAELNELVDELLVRLDEVELSVNDELDLLWADLGECACPVDDDTEATSDPDVEPDAGTETTDDVADVVDTECPEGTYRATEGGDCVDCPSTGAACDEGDISASYDYYYVFPF